MCQKSRHYHNWHHHKHHKKIHWAVLIIYILSIAAVIFNNIPKNTKAANSFLAKYDSSSLNADSAVGSTTAANDGTPASLVTGYGSSGQAAEVTNGKTLKYAVASNLNNSQGRVSLEVKAKSNILGDKDGKFYYPSKVYYDSASQYMFIADQANYRVVRTRIDGSGFATIGRPFYGTAGTVGQFVTISGIYYNAATEYLYIVDTSSNYIVKTKIDGTGWTTYGSFGTGTGQFKSPQHLYYDSSTDYFYIADANNYRIVKTKLDGSWTGWTTYGTFGTGTGQFKGPQSIKYDTSTGHFYIIEYGVNNRLVRTKLDGSWTDWSTYGTYGSGVGQYYGSVDIAYDQSTSSIYAVDAYNDRIAKITYSGGWTGWTTYGTEGSGTGQVNFPYGIAFDSSSSYFYIADYTNHRIIKTQLDGSWTGWTTYGGQGAAGERLGLGLYYPSVFLSGDTLYTADYYNRRILRTNWDGTNWSVYPQSNSYNPVSVYYDSASGYVYYAEIVEGASPPTSRLVKAKMDGTSRTTLELPGVNIVGITYDSSSDYIYFADIEGIRVIKTKIDGTGYQAFGSFGTGTGQFGTPWGIFLGADSYFYITDTYNDYVIKTKLDGSWTGWTTYGTTGVGTGQFDDPAGIYYDSSTSYAYISDANNSRIIKTKLDGSWTGWTAYGSAGSGTGQFTNPYGLTYDTSGGYIYVADVGTNGNNRIVRTKIDGTGWETYEGLAPRQVLLQSEGDGLRLELDPYRAKIYFWPSYSGNNAAEIMSDTISWTENTWHSIAATYNQSTGALSLEVDGTTTTATKSWSLPSYGTNFYVGSVPSGGYNSLGGAVDVIKIFDVSSDAVAPTNPSSLTVAKSASGGTDITPNIDNWYNYAHPYFEWAAASDTNGIDGYYVYFGTDNGADPAVTSGVVNASGSDVVFQEGRTVTIAGTLASGSTYYLRIKSKDNFGNTSTWDPTVSSQTFKYQFENTAPTNPAYVTASPSGYSSVNDYTFLWPAGSDTGGSGLAGYKYKTGAGSGSYSSWSTLTTNTQVTLTNAWYQEGANIFYLKTLDNAGNEASATQVTFYHNDSAPSAPQTLAASPSTSAESPAATNSFSFSWTAPATFSGSEAALKYYYSINETPTSTNVTEVSGTSLSAGAYATRQGQNTLYLSAKDEAGNINYGVYASVSFYTLTPAPGAPTSVSTVDGSNRDLEDYKVFLTWQAPDDQGAGFAGYTVYRSTNGTSFSSAGTTTSTTYADSSLSSQIYYYYVKSRDNAGQYSVASSTVNITPTGRFSNPPILKNNAVIITPKAYSAVVTWETQDTDSHIVHKASSFVEYGTSQDKIGKESGGDTKGQLTLADQHSVTLTGLKPDGTIYYLQAVWVDEDGNTGRSTTYSFQTANRPTVRVEGETNITLNSATIVYETSEVTTTEILYGKEENPTTRAGNQSGYTKKHTINLTGLDHSSKYYYKVTGLDQDGNSLDIGSLYDFNTLTKPYIENITMEQVKDAPVATWKIDWKTNVKTTSIVSYQPKGGKELTKSDATYTATHSITIPNLSDNSDYTINLTGFDEYGNEADYRDQSLRNRTFTTPLDSRPPKLSNITVEIRSSGVGTGQKAQLVVSWETDEPATSQIEYGPGISSSDYPSKSREDAVYSTNHVIIVSELEPSKLYHLRAVSRDKGANLGVSPDTTAITGKVQRSVIDLIVNSLERSLGFLTRIPFIGRR